MPTKLTAKNVAKILNEVMPIHETNSEQIDHLYWFYRGKQPERDRVKEVRSEIKNIVIENRAFEIVEFKTGYEFSHPVLYVSSGSSATENEGFIKRVAKKLKGEKKEENPAIIALNKYARLDSKAAKDVKLARWFNICGTAYMLTMPNKSESIDEAPYYTEVLDPRCTFVVYEDAAGQRAMLAGKCVKQTVSDGLGGVLERHICGAYSAENYFTFSSDKKITDYTKVEVSVEDNTIGMIPIVECPINEARLGWIDVGYSLFNAINTYGSNRLDDVEQFVQSLLVLINCELPTAMGENGKPVLDGNGNPVKTLPRSGDVIDVKGTPASPASVEYLTNQLDQQQTQVAKDDALDAVYETCSTPSRNDRSGGGDTGQAVLLRDGWGPAEASAKTGEKIYDEYEMSCLKIRLHILRNSMAAAEEIGDLTLADIGIRHTRNRNANMATKASVLGILLDCGVAPVIAYEICELFSDPLAAWETSKAFQQDDAEWVEKKLKIARKLRGDTATKAYDNATAPQEGAV